MKARADADLENIKEEAMTPEVVTALNKLGIDEAKDNRLFAQKSESNGLSH